VPAERRAVIDVGTNSVKLLVAEVDEASVVPVWEEGNQTRLGAGFYETHLLQAAAVQRTSQAVSAFVAAARAHGASGVRIIATSAARDAVNKEALLQAIQARCGLPVEIISGATEARWAHQGVTTEPALAGQRLLIMDTGGGSTEFVLSDHEDVLQEHSFPLGAVRLLEHIQPSDPPTPNQLTACRQRALEVVLGQIRPCLAAQMEPALARTQLVGSGGTAVILMRMHLGIDTYDRAAIEAARLSLSDVSNWVNRLWALPLAQRVQIKGLPPPRADVMLTGAVIYEVVMQTLGLAELRVSTRGLRFAALMEGWPKSVSPWNTPGTGSMAKTR
jgi:exopolyphosphatase / guanosine-5'-triphosphate,3'-diphosphate pyrophosphatase